MGIQVKWLTNSAFEITYKGQVITVDPSVRFMAYQGLDETSYAKPDYILVSHLHWDHISELRYLYSQYKPTIISGVLGRGQLVKYLDANAVDVYPAYPGNTIDFGIFKVEVLNNLHRDSGKTLEKQVESCVSHSQLIDDDILSLQEIGSLEMTNYMLTFDDGTRILIWGGEFSIVQENLLRNRKPDLALMQFSGSRSAELLSMAKAVKPLRIIPYHHDFSLTKDKWLPTLEKFRTQCPCDFIILDNCQSFEL